MRIKLFAIIVIYAFFNNSAISQRFLQMDINKFGGRVRFSIGQEIQFQLDCKKEWYKFTINDFCYDKQEIIFDEIRIPVSRISKLFLIKRDVKAITLGLGSLIGTFGITWTSYAVYGLIVASPMVGPVTFIVGGAALGIAAVLLNVKTFWKRKYKITPKRRLRVVDLTLSPDLV